MNMKAKVLVITICLLFASFINAQSAFQDNDSCILNKECKDCQTEELPPIRKEAYCGYVVQYDPCGNCTRIYKHQCKLKSHCPCNWNYRKGGNSCGFKLVKQVRVGAPVMFYVNSLNFFKYNFNVQSSDITFSSGSEGLFATFTDLLTKNVELPLQGSKNIDALEKSCTLSEDYDKLLSSFVPFTEVMDTLISDFTGIMNGVNGSSNDCQAADLDGKIKTFLKKIREIKDMNTLVLNPQEVVQQISRNQFDGFYLQAAKLEAELNKNKNCATLLPELKKEVNRLKLKDSLYLIFAKVLGKIYPFPDMEYQYNVPKVRNVDFLSFNINLKGKDSSRNYKLNMTNEQIHIPVKNGVRIDFTTGPFINYFSETIYSLHADTIFSKSKPDSAIHIGSRIVSNERGRQAHFGISTMLQMYPRQWRSFSVAPAFGIGINTNKEISFLLGGGLVMGREKKLALNGGYSLNFVKELNQSANTVGEHVNEDYTLKTMMKVKEGWFVSLTYNISLSKEKIQNSEEEEK
jgi:hypothetical protein